MVDTVIPQGDGKTEIRASADNRSDYRADFPFFKEEDIAVQYLSSDGNTRRDLQLTQDYTVSVTATGKSNQIILTDPSFIRANDLIIIYLNIPIEKNVRYAGNVGLDEELARQTLMIKQMDLNFRRSPKVFIDYDLDVTMDNPVEGNLLIWRGSKLENIDPLEIIVSAHSDNAEAIMKAEEAIGIANNAKGIADTADTNADTAIANLATHINTYNSFTNTFTIDLQGLLTADTNNAATITANKDLFDIFTNTFTTSVNNLIDEKLDEVDSPRTDQEIIDVIEGSLEQGVTTNISPATISSNLVTTNRNYVNIGIIHFNNLRIGDFYFNLHYNLDISNPQNVDVEYRIISEVGAGTTNWSPLPDGSNRVLQIHLAPSASDNGIQVRARYTPNTNAIQNTQIDFAILEGSEYHTNDGEIFDKLVPIIQENAPVSADAFHALGDRVDKNAANIFSGDYNDLTNLPVLFDGKYSSLADIPQSLSDITSKHATATMGQILSKTAGGFTYIDPPTGGGGGTGGVPLATFNAFTQSTNDSFADLPNQFANLAAYTTFAADTSQDITHLSTTVDDFPNNYIGRTTFDTFQTNQNTHNDSVNRRLTGLTASVNARVHTDAFSTYTNTTNNNIIGTANHVAANSARIKVLEDSPNTGGGVSQSAFDEHVLLFRNLSTEVINGEVSFAEHVGVANTKFDHIELEIEDLRREVSDQVTIFGEDNIDSSITKGSFVPETRTQTTLISGTQEYESGNPNLILTLDHNVYDYSNLRFKAGDPMYGEYVPRNAPDRDAPDHALRFGGHDGSSLRRSNTETAFAQNLRNPGFDVPNQRDGFEIRGDWHYQFNATNAPLSTDPRGSFVFNLPNNQFTGNIDFDTGIRAPYVNRPLIVTLHVADGSDLQTPTAGTMFLRADPDVFVRDGDDILILTNFRLVKKLPPEAITINVADEDRDDIYYTDQHLDYQKGLILDYREATDNYLMRINPDDTGGFANQSQIGIRSAPLLADFYDSPQTYTTTLNKTEIDKAGTDDQSFNSLSMTFRDRVTDTVLPPVTISAEDLKARVVSASVSNIPNTVTIQAPTKADGSLQYVPIASINVPNVDTPTSAPHDGLFYGHYQSAADGGNLRIVRRHNSRYILEEAHENRQGSGTVAEPNISFDISDDGNTLTYDINGDIDEFAPSAGSSALLTEFTSTTSDTNELYGFNNNLLVDINLETGATTVVFNLLENSNFKGDFINGTFHDSNLFYIFASSRLYSLDPDHNVLELLKDADGFGVNEFNVGGASIDTTTGTWYCVGGTHRALYTINQETYNFTRVGDTDLPTIPTAFVVHKRRGYVGSTDGFFSVELSTGVTTSIADTNVGVNLNSITGLASDGEKLYVSIRSAGTYEIGTNGIVGTRISNNTFESLVYLPSILQPELVSSGETYDINSGDFIRYNRTKNAFVPFNSSGFIQGGENVTVDVTGDGFEVNANQVGIKQGYYAKDRAITFKNLDSTETVGNGVRKLPSFEFDPLFHLVSSTSPHGDPFSFDDVVSFYYSQADAVNTARRITPSFQVFYNNMKPLIDAGVPVRDVVDQAGNSVVNNGVVTLEPSTGGTWNSAPVTGLSGNEVRLTTSVRASVSIPEGFSGVAYRFWQGNANNWDGDFIYIDELGTVPKVISRYSNSNALLSASVIGRNLTVTSSAEVTFKYIRYLR